MSRKSPIILIVQVRNQGVARSVKNFLGLSLMYGLPGFKILSLCSTSSVFITETAQSSTFQHGRHILRDLKRFDSGSMTALLLPTVFCSRVLLLHRYPLLSKATAPRKSKTTLFRKQFGGCLHHLTKTLGGSLLSCSTQRVLSLSYVTLPERNSPEYTFFFLCKVTFLMIL